LCSFGLNYLQKPWIMDTYHTQKALIRSDQLLYDPTQQDLGFAKDAFIECYSNNKSYEIELAPKLTCARHLPQIYARWSDHYKEIA
jgi:hypothetical protein